MMRYTFTDDAERDFDRAALDLEALQQAPALRIGQSIQEALDLLCRYPEIGRVDEMLTRKSRRKIRRLLCWPYILFYYVDAEQIRVVGLIDGRQDAETLMRTRAR